MDLRGLDVERWRSGDPAARQTEWDGTNVQPGRMKRDGQMGKLNGQPKTNDTHTQYRSHYSSAYSELRSPFVFVGSLFVCVCVCAWSLFSPFS